MGTPEFAVPSLERIRSSSHELIAVVSAPDKPVGRGLKIQPSPVKRAAETAAFPILQPANLSDPNFIHQLTELAADLFVVVAFRILPSAVFHLPPKGAINLHASLLPKYRGAAPINWAIINGETETGVSTIFIQEQVDTGDLILQKAIPIGHDETAGELHNRLANLGAELLLETITQIDEGKAARKHQIGEATKAPKLTKELLRIDWTQPAEKVRNLIRGLSPSPAAFAHFREKTVKLLKASAVEALSKSEPGQIVDVENKSGRLIVGCGSGQLEILQLQPEGKRSMSSKEYLMGHAINVGEKFD
jgi:methionyl-tRNA formyltransferase